MSAYLPGHPDLDGEPDIEPNPCWCEHFIEAHTGPADECQLCSCEQYAERAEVEATANQLAYDDWEGNRYGDTEATALELVRRRRLHLIGVLGATEVPRR